MFFDLNGPDFIRAQRSAQSRIGDALDPDVLFSGAYDDGQGYVYQVSVDAPGVGNTKTYTLNLSDAVNGFSFVIAMLKLTQPMVQNGQTVFNSGEYVTPNFYRYQVSGQLPAYDFNFSASLIGTTQLSVVVGGMTGVATVLILDV